MACESDTSSIQVTKLLGLLESSLETFETVKVCQESVKGEKVLSLTLRVISVYHNRRDNSYKSEPAVNLLNLLQAGLPQTFLSNLF